MKKVKKIVVWVLLSLLTVVIVTAVTLQFMAKDAVMNFLERKIPSHIDLAYKNMSVNLLTGTLEVDDLSVTLYNRDSLTSHTKVSADKFILGGLNYWQYYMNNTISADNILVQKPNYIYYRHKRTAKTDTVPGGVVNLLKTIKVGKVSVENGRFIIFTNEQDSVLVKSEGINFVLMNGRTDTEIIKKKIPIEYKGYSFSAGTAFVDLGPYEVLNIGGIAVEDNHININDIILESKYSKTQMSRILRKERDHIALSVPQIAINNVDFGYHRERFYINSDSVEILKPNLGMYRDKLVADNTSSQKMYGRMLRQLPIDIAVPLVRIINANMVYEERIHPTGTAGSLDFNDINAEISSLRNSSSDGKNTSMVSSGKLMGTSVLHFEYSFDVNDEHDQFFASGALSGLRADHVNSFLKPNLNVEAEGIIHQMYFTIHGNAVSSSGDMKMNYDNFKFDVLAKDGARINKLLTAVGNLFINDGSKADAEGFRYGEIDVERDVRKSFFNYMWINMRDGIVSTLTGDGKKQR